MKHLILAAALMTAIPLATASAQYGRPPGGGPERGPAHGAPPMPGPGPAPGGGLMLYVGVVPNCNDALVSAVPNLRGCPTRPLGTVAAIGPGGRLFAGPGGAVAVSGGRLLGQLAANGRQELYVGLQRGCNQGIVTTMPRYLNCATQAIGWVR
jgi:hypothetical protein